MLLYKWNEMENFSEKILIAGQVILAWFILVLLSPFLLVIFGGLWIWKNAIVWLTVKVFRRKFLSKFDHNEAVFAVDRFWESSRSSLGLIVELEGTLNVDEFRDAFRKKVLDYPTTQNDEEEIPKSFAKLTQIPSTFGGYYFWQKANYFIIHEHIRQINQPTDELGLKKAVGTLMTLPFPNRRPLWEILVYSNYLGTTTVGRGTTCGTILFIRIHRAVADSHGLLSIFNRMLVADSAHATLQVKSIQVTGQDVQPKESEKDPSPVPISAFSTQLIFEKVTNLVYFPFHFYLFAKEIIKTPEGLMNSSTGESSNNDMSYSDWANLSEISIWKACATQAPKLSRSTIELTLLLEGLTSRGRRHKCLNIPDEKGVPTGKCLTSVLIPYPHVPQQDNQILSNNVNFICVKCPCLVNTDTQAGGNKGIFLKQINDNLHQPFEKNQHLVKFSLKLLALLPRHMLRYILMACPWGAGYLTYEQFHMELSHNQAEDLKVFGQHVVSQVVPLVSLQWTHTVASAATLKWNDRQNVVMSLIASPGILGPMSEGNPQDLVESIVRGFPEDLERLGEDEEHGFVSIPIS